MCVASTAGALCGVCCMPFDMCFACVILDLLCCVDLCLFVRCSLVFFVFSTKSKDNNQNDGGMINQSEELFTSLSSRYHQQEVEVKPDSFEDENHIGNVVINASSTESEEIEDNNEEDITKVSEELYNKILQEEQQALDVKDNTAATDEVAEVTKASEELYHKINTNIIKP